MLKNFNKKFLENELLGLKQIRHAFYKQTNSKPDEELTKENYPAHYKISEEISNQAQVWPSNKLLVGNENETGGIANTVSLNIKIKRGSLNNDKIFVGAYAHELGHIKNVKLDSRLSMGYLKFPYLLLLSATTNLYGIGLSAYTVMGENKMLDLANGLFHHTGKYLVAAAVVNTVFARTREHMADLFGYKQTGLLPSEYSGQEKRNGIIGNVSKAISDVNGFLQTGYPSYKERDFICKILGKKPQGSSFVDRLKSDREQTSNNKQTNI